MGGIAIRAIDEADRGWLRRFIAERWGAESVIVHDTVLRPAELSGFVAIVQDELAGLVTFRIVERGCEVVTLDSVRPGIGVGSALLGAIEEVARGAGCRRIWLVTTNDNVNALRFYQKRGYELVRIDRGAVARARRLKPEIPPIGDHGIPLRDEIELERPLCRG